MQIKIKDGSVLEVEDNQSVNDVALKISEGLAKKAVAGKINGKLVQLSTCVSENDTVEIVTLKDKEGLEVLRHSTAHVLALAVKRLFPKTKLSIGPAIENGFYYDFDFDTTVCVEDLKSLEAEMEKIIKSNLKFERKEVSRVEAAKIFKDLGEDYKLILLDDIKEDETITLYTLGELVDLCRGPHLEDIGLIKAFKLTSITGAYFKGDEKNKMLTRIYGLSFPKKSELDEHLAFLEEVKKRDNRKLGKELEIYFISEYAPGMPFYMPNGMIILNELIEFWRAEQHKLNYIEIQTPIALSKELWELSGHWGYYNESMYTFNVDEHTEYAIKPMSCPGCMLYYKENIHSYKDLPLRIAELGKVHRKEDSGALSGLFRVRCFTQDDAHIFMLPEQIEQEVISVLNLIERTYKTFGLEFSIELSTMPAKHIGEVAEWDFVEEKLKNALKSYGKDYEINAGDGAFYGPKIDIKIKDALGRSWQGATVQLDMQLPKRFDVNYIDADGSRKEPIMIHRAIFGSLERFLGILIEHFAGAFPLWLAPVQVKIINVSEKQTQYCEQLTNKLNELGIRVSFDSRNEKIGYKIREAQLKKVPYMLVIGDEEVNNGNVTVRHRKDGDLGKMSIEDFISLILDEKTNKIIR